MARAQYTEGFKRDYERLPEHLKDATDKQIRNLIADRSHPSLRLKKMKKFEHIWEARVSHGYRITCIFRDEDIILYRVGPHDIERRPR